MEELTGLDLFEHPELLPSDVAGTLDAMNDELESSDPYEVCGRYLGELGYAGYTFDYGLDGMPYNLRKMES